MARQRADTKRLASHRDSAQFREFADIDDQFRGDQPQIHRGHQALAARQHLRPLAMRGKQFQRIGNAGRACIGESRGFHSGEPSPALLFCFCRD